MKESVLSFEEKTT